MLISVYQGAGGGSKKKKEECGGPFQTDQSREQKHAKDIHFHSMVFFNSVAHQPSLGGGVGARVILNEPGAAAEWPSHMLEASVVTEFPADSAERQLANPKCFGQGSS